MGRTEVTARIRESEKGLLRDIIQVSGVQLWYLDRQVWSRKGAVTRCLRETVRELSALLDYTTKGDASLPRPTTPIRLNGCAPLWSETGLSWTDTMVLVDAVLHRMLEAVSDEASPGPSWLVQAALNGLKVDIAATFLRAQADEMARQREINVASQHLATRFLANASHELRTPLTAVLGFSELLQEEMYGPLTADQQTAVGHIENSAQNLLEIVGNVLDLMQVRSGRLQLQYRRMAVDRVLRNIFDILMPLSKRRKVDFEFEIPVDLGSVEADESIVRHIVYQLVQSALRATPENGKVVLRAQRTDSTLTIITYDTALHFPPEAIENMNDAYPMLENSPARGYEGWEIGLPLVRRYVELHRGSLDIASTPESGTTIQVLLPTRRPPGTAELRGSYVDKA